MAGATKIAQKMVRENFVREYVKNNGNGTKAAMASKKGLKYDSARRLATSLMREKGIKEQIQQAMIEQGVDFNFLMNVRKNIIVRGVEKLKKGEMKISAQDLHNNLQGLEKVLLATSAGNVTNRPALHMHFQNGQYPDVVKERTSHSNVFQDIEDAEEGTVIK